MATLAESGAPPPTNRRALVTGGATVPFKELLDEIVTPDFIASLKAHGFSQLDIQCGDYYGVIKEKAAGVEDLGVGIETFAFDDNLKGKMLDCRGEKGVRPAGIIIGHAGTGTISDSWETQTVLVVVPNPNLMDNHQAEFAEEMAKEHRNIVLGHLGKLSDAIHEAVHVIQEDNLDFLPPYQEPVFPVSEQDRITVIDRVVHSSLSGVW